MIKINNSYKIYLILDYSMNNIQKKIFDEFLAVEDSLPPKLKNKYYIDKYKALNNHLFKKFYYVIQMVNEENPEIDIEIISNYVMDDFSENIEETIKKLYDSFVRFIGRQNDNVKNTNTLANIQINSILLETALILSKNVSDICSSDIAEMMRINNRLLVCVDNRTIKEDYNQDEELDKLTIELGKKICNYQWSTELLTKTRSYMQEILSSNVSQRQEN